MGNFKTISNFILNCLFPLRCVACAARIESGALCPECRSKLVLRNGFICPVCRRRTPEPRTACHPNASFLLLASVSFGQNQARELVHSLKYAGQKNSAAEMAELMAANYRDYLAGIFNSETVRLVPAPLSSRGLRRRGFNQAELLAGKISAELGSGPRVELFLQKIKDTKSQTECADKRERAENVRDIFCCRGNPSGLDLVVVDDVFTSGATMREMVKTLKAAGARRVVALVFAEA